MPPSQEMWMRDISSDVNGVKTTFSSWDACMDKVYCKYPVIIAIVIVSLIVLSILFCVVRCACCGLECCCGCFSCCNACCPSPRNRRRDKLDDPPPGGGGWRAQAGSTAYHGYQPQVPPSYNPPAQYAQFETGRGSKNVHSDALPSMPTWENATTHKMLDESHDVEMDHMTPHDEQKAPMLAHQAPSPAHADSFAAAASPYQQHYGDLGDPYARQDQADPLDRYGGANRLSTGNPYASSAPSPYGNAPSPYHNGSYATTQASYGTAPVAAGAMPSHQQRSLSPPVNAHSPPPSELYGASASAGTVPRSLSPGSPAHSSPPHTGSAELPGALMAGKTSSPPPPQHTGTGFQAYNPAGQQQSHGYAAYSPGP